MSALDQAFIKAYSQQNPALAVAAVETAKKTCTQQNPVNAAASVETAKSVASTPGAVKAVQAVPSTEAMKRRSKHNTKVPCRSASDGLFEALERTDGAETAAAKTARTNKPATTGRAKKSTPPTARRPSRATREKTAKKPKTKSEHATTAPTVNGLGVPNVIYRLDMPPPTTGGGVSTSVRPAVPAPHTDAIFSEMETLPPQREPTPNQSVLPSTETHPLKNPAPQKVEPMPETRTAAANQAVPDGPGGNQLAQTFSAGWAEDFTRAFSNFDQRAPTGNPVEPVREQEIAKKPAEHFASQSAGMRQTAAAQVPLPEKKLAREDAPRTEPERTAVLEKNNSTSGSGSNQDIKSSSPAKPEAAETPPTPAIRLFQPMLQVDHFAWPKVCGRLETGAHAELDRVIETLIAAQIRGKKVFALGGCHSGDGASSLLLATARRLAAQDMKAALVEADWSQPQLARRLGLLPQYGWEDVLAGRLPLEEVLIESIAERLVILPVREPFGASELPADAANRLAETWNSLRHHFDIVLVDPGPLCNSPILDKQLVGVMAGRIDATLLVKNLRRHDSSEFDAVGQALNNAGAKVLGVVENFVG